MFRLAKRIEKKWMMHYPFVSKKLCTDRQTNAANRLSSNKIYRFHVVIRTLEGRLNITN